MADKYKYIRWLAYIIEILVFFVIQQTPGLIPEIFGGRPLLLLPILVGIAMFETEITSLFFGLFIGILLDVGLWDIIGFYAILFAVLGYVISVLAANLFQTNLLTSVIVTAVCIIIVYSLYYLFCYVLKFYDAPIYEFVNHFLARMAYTLVLSPIVYFFNKALALQVRAKD